MGDRSRRRRGICILGVLALMASRGASAADTNVKSIAAGLSYEHFSRPVVWPGDDAASRILSRSWSDTGSAVYSRTLRRS